MHRVRAFLNQPRYSIWDGFFFVLLGLIGAGVWLSANWRPWAWAFWGLLLARFIGVFLLELIPGLRQERSNR